MDIVEKRNKTRLNFAGCTVKMKGRPSRRTISINHSRGHGNGAQNDDDSMHMLGVICSLGNIAGLYRGLILPGQSTTFFCSYCSPIISHVWRTIDSGGSESTKVEMNFRSIKTVQSSLVK